MVVEWGRCGYHPDTADAFRRLRRTSRWHLFVTRFHISRHFTFPLAFRLPRFDVESYRKFHKASRCGRVCGQLCMWFGVRRGRVHYVTPGRDGTLIAYRKWCQSSAACVRTEREPFFPVMPPRRMRSQNDFATAGLCVSQWQERWKLDSLDAKFLAKEVR